MIAPPAEVLIQYLVNSLLIVRPPTAGWQAYRWNEPPGITPLLPTTITFYDTGGVGGRDYKTGKWHGHFTNQLRLRAVNHDAGWSKGGAIQKQFDEMTRQVTVNVGVESFQIDSVYGYMRLTPIGIDQQLRMLFTMNVRWSLREL